MTTMTAREALFDAIRRDLRYALIHFGGHGQTGGWLDAEAWRHAKPDDLIEAMMVHLRAGLSPRLEAQAIEDGVASAREFLARQAAEAAPVQLDLFPGATP